MISEIPRREGPRIVAIGGGTGLSTMLRGLKHYTKNITAIVTVADDGGGSGMLRQDLGMPPPGDIRNCIAALANTEPIMQALLNYRFQDGSLTGQSFGNLFLAALNGVAPTFDQAVALMGDVLAITGRVLPVTNANVDLVAHFANGTSVMGESSISSFKKLQKCRIDHVRLIPEHPPALPEAIEAIRKADVILLGPGSLYTSIIPNLLVDGIADAVAANKSALRIYVANIMTQEGETESYTVADHLTALFYHSRRGLVDVCLANSAQIPESTQELYRTENAEPTSLSRRQVAALGVDLVTRDLADETLGRKARHDPIKLATAIRDLVEERCVRTWAKGELRFVIER